MKKFTVEFTILSNSEQSSEVIKKRIKSHISLMGDGVDNLSVNEVTEAVVLDLVDNEDLKKAKEKYKNAKAMRKSLGLRFSSVNEEKWKDRILEITESIKVTNKLSAIKSLDKEDRFEYFWKLYGLKGGPKGSKAKTKTQWNKLNKNKKEFVLKFLNDYLLCSTNSGEDYRFNAERFLSANHWKNVNNYISTDLPLGHSIMDIAYGEDLVGNVVRFGGGKDTESAKRCGIEKFKESFKGELNEE